MSGLIFPIAWVHAVLRDDLLEVDSILRRTVNYVFVSIVLALAYAGLLPPSVNVWRRSPCGGGASVVIFATIAFLVFLPLRLGWAGIDRLFFPVRHDCVLVETTSDA